MKKIFLFITICLLISCWDSDDKSVKIDTIKIIRFDEDFKSIDPTNLETSESKMVGKYGDLYKFYIEFLMGLGVMSPKTDQFYYGNHIGDFLNGEYAAMMDTCQRYIVKDIDEIESELTDCYGRLQGHFPEKKPSKIFSFFISPQSENCKAAFTYGNDTIGINWFYYLGKNFSLYEPVFISQGFSYMVEWNQKDYIARNVMLTEYNLLYEKLKPKEVQSELIYNMIEEGKKYYYLDQVCKNTKDWVKIGYSEPQYKWCQDNEFEIWAHYKEKKLLYSIEQFDLKKNIEEGPSTPGMPKESPGMVGSWVGWQIVKKYMDVKKYSLKQLIQTSPKEIFKLSEYKPMK